MKILKFQVDENGNTCGAWCLEQNRCNIKKNVKINKHFCVSQKCKLKPKKK